VLLPFLVGACIQDLCLLSIYNLSYLASVSIQVCSCTVEVGFSRGSCDVYNNAYCHVGRLRRIKGQTLFLRLHPHPFFSYFHFVRSSSGMSSALKKRKIAVLGSRSVGESDIQRSFRNVNFIRAPVAWCPDVVLSLVFFILVRRPG